VGGQIELAIDGPVRPSLIDGLFGNDYLFVVGVVVGRFGAIRGVTWWLEHSPDRDTRSLPNEL